MCGDGADAVAASVSRPDLAADATHAGTSSQSETRERRHLICQVVMALARWALGE